jgi:hypothetical protein
MFGEQIMCRHVPKVPYGSSYAPDIEAMMQSISRKQLDTSQ